MTKVRIGGPHIVTIHGFDGAPPEAPKDYTGPPVPVSPGKPLFKAYETKVVLPEQSNVHDFVIPTP